MYYFVPTPICKPYLRISLDSHAASIQRKRAFDFSFRCLVKPGGGCDLPCDYLPSAWQDWKASKLNARVPVLCVPAILTVCIRITRDVNDRAIGPDKSCSRTLARMKPLYENVYHRSWQRVAKKKKGRDLRSRRRSILFDSWPIYVFMLAMLSVRKASLPIKSLAHCNQ